MKKNLNIEDKKSRVDEIEAGEGRTLILCPSLTAYLDDGDDGDDDGGLQAHSHHDKFPPWWVFVRDDYGGNLSVTKSHH